jgi:hypothetical protein
MGSPPQKGGKNNNKLKKTLVLTMEPARKGREKKKKNPVLTLGSPPEKGGKKKLPWY